MPNLPRIRTLLSNADLFVIVQDAFMTQTAEFADVVLPSAMWGEKTGCFTNVDRTVHITSPQAKCALDESGRRVVGSRPPNAFVYWDLQA